MECQEHLAEIRTTKGECVMQETKKEIDYREAYELEHLKTADLAARVASLEAKNE